MNRDLPQIYDQLFAYCEAERFAGYDPFDGLNSKLFQSTPLRHIALVRIAWLQMVKRSPANLRPILQIEKELNAKGLALFAMAEASRFRATTDPKHAANVADLLRILRGLQGSGVSKNGKPTAAFGYNFDWQSRAFFAPKGTPTIVPTAFAARAFIESYEMSGSDPDLTTANEICEFIVSDLKRPIENTDELCFSYTPLDDSVIYNASLLAGETLAHVGALTANGKLLGMAEKTARYVIRNQEGNGSWKYGPKMRHAWVDNFHTAFILLSLHRISDLAPHLKGETEKAIERGITYWLDNFFLDDGTPRYFDTATYPVDIHSAAAAIVALCELAAIDGRALPLARKVAQWTIENLRDPAGFFYYQRRRAGTVKIPFIRWGQAWMAFALARLIEADSNNG